MESKYWKNIHETRWALRDATAMGHFSYATLLLAAYYHGINETDSALFYYEKFLSSGILSRMRTTVLSANYTFLPDTIVNVYTRNIQPLLIGLSECDLKYLADGAGDMKAIGERINHVLAEVAVSAAGLKGNRTFVHQKNAIAYKSKFNEIAMGFADNINKIVTSKTEIIGNPKSSKYRYNIMIDFYNERLSSADCPGWKRSWNVGMKDIPQKGITTVLFLNGDENFDNNVTVMQYNPKLIGAEIRLDKYFKRNKAYSKPPSS